LFISETYIIQLLINHAQVTTMDPRFYTPRQCGSVSSRSQHSQNSDGSTTNSYTTARDSQSVRSAGSSVYRTPRSSPFPSNRRHRSSHDRRKDLRRFSDHGVPHQHRQPANQYYNDEYDNSQPIQIQRTEARRHRDYDRVEQQQQQEESRPPPNILSLARHGRSSEVQASPRLVCFIASIQVFNMSLVV